MSDNSSDFYDDFSLAESCIFKVNPYHNQRSDKSLESEYDAQEDESFNEATNDPLQPNAPKDTAKQIEKKIELMKQDADFIEFNKDTIAKIS